MYAAYRSQRNFRDADAYIPDAWLGHPHFATDERDFYRPFLFGHCNRIGKKYVNLEFIRSLVHSIGALEPRLALARMTWKFNLGICEETDLDRRINKHS